MRTPNLPREYPSEAIESGFSPRYTTVEADFDAERTNSGAGGVQQICRPRVEPADR